MKKLKNLCQVSLGKAAACAVFVLLAVLSVAPAFAQTAEVKKVGVYYKNKPTTLKEMYCDFTGGTERSFVDTPAPGSNTVQQKTTQSGDPWVSSALIEFDQPFPSTVLSDPNHTYPNHCLSLCMDIYCNNLPIGQSTYSIAFPLQEIRFDIVKYYNGKNVENKDDTPPVRTIDLFPEAGGSTDVKKFKCGSYRCTNGDKHDNSGNWGECIGAKQVCIDSECTSCVNADTGVSETCNCGSSVFSVGHSNCLFFNADGTSTHGHTPITYCAAWDGNYEHDGEMGKSNGTFAYRASVHTNTPGDGVIVNGNIEIDSMIAYPGMNQIPIQVDVTNVHTVRSTPYLVGKITPVAAQPYTLVYRISKDADVRAVIFDASTSDSTGYGIGTVSTVDENFCNAVNATTFPSATWFGNKCRVPAYTTGTECEAAGLTWAGSYCAVWTVDETTCGFAGFTWDNGSCYASGSGYEYTSFADTPEAAAGRIVRTLADWQPRVGEGMKGNDQDKLVNAFENWDGRNKDGLLLPAGNYMAAIQAKSLDEWKGVDFSRTVTRQLSLDPLVLTDVQLAGLTKKSTAYALISYIPTESSNVYWEIYTPGTVFEGATNAGEGINTDSSTQTGTGPTVKTSASTETATVVTGTLVFRSEENRTGRTTYTSRWDGTCQAYKKGTAGVMEPTTCTITYSKGAKKADGTVCSTDTGCPVEFAHGAPMPDGNYVSVLWAEVPYNGSYKNAAGTTDKKPVFTVGGTCEANTNKTCFTGVKTLKYDTRNLEVERGLVGITIQPVSYSTIGSSPTAYGLDPFIFQYALDRDAQVIASVQNTAGIKVRYLTPKDGTANVAQQLNRLSWDGRDEQGRMVTPGTYMFVVEAHDAMFPARSNRASAVFPVDMYRLTDLTTTDVYGDSNARATISYLLSKAMNVQINIYNKDVVIPNYNSITGEYGGTAAWPPRVCNRADDVFDGDGAVSPAKVAAGGATTACIYVNDAAFVKSMYPATAAAAADTDNLNVRLQPIETMDRSALKSGDGMLIMEEWDALYFRNPKNCSSTTTTKKTDCKYEMIPDGTYPFFVSARSDEPFNRYYFDANRDGATLVGTNGTYTLNGEPFKTSTTTATNDYADVKAEPYWYATEKPVSKINITRGPVYFLDGSVAVYPNAPQLFNASTGPTFIPPYEIDFSVSRAAEVEISIIALEDNVCSPISSVGSGTTTRNNKAGDVCKFLSTMTIVNTGSFDANIIRKTFWDGTDHNGNYVKPGIYEVRLTARNYPNNDLYEETVKSITVNADLFKVFDLLDVDSYAIATRNTDMHVGYQISVPMKVAIQIFKPGTTIYDYSKGTLRNPTTGTEVKDIHEVLVRAIVGIRPSMTLIDEVWDGRDYAQQEVPDGTYPFRFVTAINSADIDSVTGEIVGDWASTDGQSLNPSLWKINKVADTKEYQNLHKATVAIGDGRFVCEDWEKTVFFYPNPLNDASKGTLEITKMPVPGTVSIKFFNLAGDLVREGDYTCVDANNYQVQMGNSLYFQPDNNVSNNKLPDVGPTSAFPNIRNAALRCRWDRTNQHGKKVARGVYFGLVDFRAQNGREHCQKVVKIIVP